MQNVYNLRECQLVIVAVSVKRMNIAPRKTAGTNRELAIVARGACRMFSGKMKFRKYSKRCSLICVSGYSKKELFDEAASTLVRSENPRKNRVYRKYAAIVAMCGTIRRYVRKRHRPSGCAQASKARRRSGMTTPLVFDRMERSRKAAEIPIKSKGDPRR
jgi:hypothetical protein